ncbi:unnamed protein product [Adineta steineri]|uniref:C2H2-type domain-containing protein n=1 Tax=Adineta steineri TaxID=433720 RepID=A0A814BS41_9BILA|nr:unnamed protein product [Adineta steineri]
MSSEFFCKICDIPCTGKAPYEQHINSAKHIKKAQLNSGQISSEQSRLINIKSSPTTNTQTSFATTNYNSSDDSSISSTSFLVSPETMRILLEWNHPLDYKPYCDICHLPLYGKDNADIHFDSNNKIHIQKLNAWKQIQEGGKPYSCSVCSELFSNENLMREHFVLSTTHADAIKQRNNLEKIIKIYETYNKLKQMRKQSKEVGSTDDTDIVNKFQSLNVIDATTPATKSRTNFAINLDAFKEVMEKVAYDDDDNC